MTATGTGRYVPPHMRNREPSATAGPSKINTPSRESHSAPVRNSRTPWSLPQREDCSVLHSSNHRDEDKSNTPGHQREHSSAPSRFGQNGGHSSSASPTLHVFGDSFTGPLKLLSDSNARVTTYKGSSAKGLNNPNSFKQVSNKLVPALNALLAPPPYAYTPSTGRWALLIFGNVDLQINYLWQLQNKPISSATFASSLNHSEVPDLPPTSDSQVSSSVLADATETVLQGPALGPEGFVEAVIKAYTTWLEREIINGPVGTTLRDRKSSPPGPGRRKPPPGKVLVAAALPPLVEDEILPRIPEKYVERLEEDHAKAQKAMQNEVDRGSRTPWARAKDDEDMEEGVSTLSMSDDPPQSSSPRSAQSTCSSSHASTMTTDTDITISPASRAKPVEKTSIESLLLHDPPLCTLPTRIRMTDHYNRLLAAFCDQHPDELSFVNITESILAGNAPDAELATPGSADRGTWACPVDPTNIHPLWESTLPLWLDALGQESLPTQDYKISEDAEDTFKAYEVDKRRRFANGPLVQEGRIKLRDE